MMTSSELCTERTDLIAVCFLHSLTPFDNTWLTVLPQYTPVYSSILQYTSVYYSILQYTSVYYNIPLVVDVAYRYQELQLLSEDSTLELTEKGDSTLELTEVDDATPELTEDRVKLGNYRSG